MKRATVGMSGFVTKLLGAIAPLGGMLSAIAIPLGIVSQCIPQQVLAQISAGAGTNTNVNSAGNTINITGGQLSGDRQNLFHNFQQFGLNSDQTANFIPPNADISNILGRVMGGNPSVINGVIQIQPRLGTPNLYLMNPAGIIFGASASLNVPASFTATTATSIGFGNNWFNAAGVNDNYAALDGTPTSFAFNVNQPGTIINAGNLSVNGGDLTLLGGTVVNTGNVSAPGGQITVAAVEGGRLVQIKQQGMLLSLEVEPLPTTGTQPRNWALPVQSLPQLLTGGSGGNATGLTVNNQGQVVLTGSDIQVDTNTGSVTVSGTSNLSASRDLKLQADGNVGSITIQNSQLTAKQDLILQAPQGNIRVENSQLQREFSISTGLSEGRDIQLTGQSITIQENSRLESERNLSVTAQQNITVTESQLQSLENMQLVAQNTVQVSDDANPSIIRAGGNLTVQGNQSINIQALNRPQSVFQSGGNLNLASNGTITGNARFISDGNFSVLNLAGQPGNFSYTPISSTGIISSNGDVNIGGNYRGASLKVEARGSITGGNITITQPNTELQGTDSDIAILSNDPALILRAGLTELKNTQNVLPSLTELRNSPTIPPARTLGEATFTSTSGSSSPASITVGNITTSRGPVILSAPGNITTGAIATGGDNNSNSNTFGGFVLLSAGGNIEVKTIDTGGTDGGDVTIVAGSTFRATGTLLVRDLVDNNSNTDQIEGQAVIGFVVPTSIYATGGGNGGANISIKHGGSSFVVGPDFQTDDKGNIIYRLLQRDANDDILLDANGNPVLGEPVVPSRKADGSINFVNVNRDTTFDGDHVFALSTPIATNDPFISFTAGAITSNQENKGLVVSFRDRPLIGNGTVVTDGRRISITSSFTPSDGGTDGNVDTGGGTGSDGGIGTSTGTSTSTGINTGTGSTTDTGSNTGSNTDSTTDTGTDASGSGSVQMGTEIFEHQNKPADRLIHCRTSQEQSEKTTEEEKTDRSDEEDCEKIDFFQRLNSQLTILRIELHLPADAPTQANSSILRSYLLDLQR